MESYKDPQIHVELLYVNIFWNMICYTKQNTFFLNYTDFFYIILYWSMEGENVTCPFKI